MGKLSRTKGRAWEQRTVRDLKAAGIDAKRVLQFRGEADGADVLAAVDIVGPPDGEGNQVHTLHLAIECKHQKRVSWRRAWEQVCAHESTLVDVAVRAKDDRCDPVWIVSDRLMMRLLGG